jgi:hypothetical protein
MALFLNEISFIFINDTPRFQRFFYLHLWLLSSRDLIYPFNSFLSSFYAGLNLPALLPPAGQATFGFFLPGT